MNNLEKLLQDSSEKGATVEDLLCIMNDSLCNKCPAYSFCKTEKGRTLRGCAETRAHWLLQEYVEPDSWEKIEADATKTYSDYWKCADMDCDTCPAVFKGFLTPYEYYDTDGFSVAIKCANAQKCDLVARCKKLGAVE